MRTALIKAVTLVALFCLVLGVASCKPKKTAGPDANEPAPGKTNVEPAKTDVKPAKPDVKPIEPVTTTEAPDTVLVTVNGVDITQKQLDAMLKPYLDRLAKQATSLPPAFLEQQKTLYRQQALQEMIRMQLLNEQVKLSNIVVTDQDIEDEIAKAASQQKPAETVEQFKKKMENYGLDFEQLKGQIRAALSQQKLIAKEFPDEVKFTEEDAKAYYEQNKAKYEIPEQTRASHILIKTDLTDPNSDPNQVKAVARAKAEDLLKQVKEGADFAALAKANSDCPSAARGGDLDFFTRGRMVPEFDKAAFELEVGQISDIVQTQYGFHIIKVTDRKEPTTTSFEEAKATIMAEQSQRKLRELALKYVEKLKADAKIVYAPGMEPEPAAPPRLPGTSGAAGNVGATPK